MYECFVVENHNARYCYHSYMYQECKIAIALYSVSETAFNALKDTGTSTGLLLAIHLDMLSCKLNIRYSQALMPVPLTALYTMHGKECSIKYRAGTHKAVEDIRKNIRKDDCYVREQRNRKGPR